MDLLDRLLGHDTWTTRVLLQRAHALSDEELDQEFDIGHRSVRATADHIIFNMEVWAALMAGQRPDTSRGSLPEDRTVPALVARLEAAASHLADVARVIADGGAWNELWTDTLDEPPTRKSYGGAIAHVITHSMHHRAQLLYMLRKLDVMNLPEGDVLSWEQQLSPIKSLRDEATVQGFPIA
ncbi:MAG: DinB family protein [Gemmatimonadetes bacterium]|nr:DinB family protein [Gemmatimonadota bacterium]